MLKNKYFRILMTSFSIAILTIAGSIWLQIAIAAWQGPAADPPSSNVDAPLNVGSDLQRKVGGLDIQELYFQEQASEIDFDSGGPALIFDATDNGDWDMLLYEGGLHMGSGENLYLNNSGIYDDNDGIVNVGESLAVTGNSLTVNGSEVCRADGTNCPSVSDTNNYVTGVNFDTGNGILTLTRQGLGSLTEDLDGRYLTNYTETDPQVGNLDNGDWCIASGGQVVCNQSAPSGGGDITGVYSGEGTKGGSSSGNATIEFDCSEVDGTGISCSGEDIQVKNTYFSCSSGSSLRSINIDTGSKTCETDDVGGSGGCEDVFDSVGTDSGTAYASGCSDTLYIRGGTNVSTRESGNRIYIDSSGGSPSVTTRSSSNSGSGDLLELSTTVSCPSGYVRTGCSPVCDAQAPLRKCKAYPQGSGCKCVAEQGQVMGTPNMFITCEAYCLKID